MIETRCGVEGDGGCPIYRLFGVEYDFGRSRRRRDKGSKNRLSTHKQVQNEDETRVVTIALCQRVFNGQAQ